MAAPETIPDDAFVGPCKIDCDEGCDVPAGLVMAPVPRPRHARSDVLACPNCERAFIIYKKPAGYLTTEEQKILQDAQRRAATVAVNDEQK